MKFKIAEKQYEGNPIWDWMSKEARNLIGSTVIMCNSPDGKDAVIAKLIAIDNNSTAYHHFVSNTRVGYSNCGRRNSRERKFMYIAPIGIAIPDIKHNEVSSTTDTYELRPLLEKRVSITKQLEQKNLDVDRARKELNILHEEIIAKTTNCNDLLASREALKKELELVESNIDYVLLRKALY